MNKSNSKLKYDIIIDLPYPQVNPESCNPSYAQAMISNVGDCNSEMSAVGLYFYNSVILNEEYADIAKCFHKISIVEMHHLDIFANFACKMGLDPRMWSVNCRCKEYWSPSCLQYPREIKKVIKYSINQELAAIEKYTKQAANIRDKNIVDNLERIILDEERHIDIFNNMLERIC